MPALMLLMQLVRRLALPRRNVPLPFLAKPAEASGLASTAEMVLDPLRLVSVGCPELTARVSGPPVPALKIQLFGAPVPVSPKVRLPIVRAPSSVTVLRAVMSSVLKSAVLSVLVAITPLSQLAAADQLPEPLPLTRLVQVPLCAQVVAA